MIKPFAGKTPQLGPEAWVADNATVIGDVVLGARASIWYGAVLRGDVERISIGAGSNVQDNSVVHVDSSGFGTTVGENVTIGHKVVLHGCTIGNGVLIGIGAIVLNGAVIGEGALVGAGALVPPGAKIPAGMLAVGVPARVRRPLTDEEKDTLRDSAAHYIELARGHR